MEHLWELNNDLSTPYGLPFPQNWGSQKPTKNFKILARKGSVGVGYPGTAQRF